MSFESFKRQSTTKQESVIHAGIEEFSCKSYTDANTDCIAKKCGISKGLLFHYFGSKKEFYLYCLSQSLETLMEKSKIPQGDFYTILFTVMDEKIKLCSRYPAQTKLVNMASKDSAAEVAAGKSEIFQMYAVRTHETSSFVMEKALLALPIKIKDNSKIKEGLLLYINTIMNKYLLAYQNMPDEFFRQAETIKLEMKEYIDLILYGIIKEGS